MRRLPSFEKQLALAVSLAFIFGNFCLWHANQGHVTFSLVHLGLAAMYGVIRLALISGRTWKLAGLIALVATCYFSGGTYHSFTFFVLPLSVAALLFAGQGLVRARGRPQWPWRRLSTALVAGLLGIVLATPKVLAILDYQRASPRTLAGHRESETTSFLQTLVYQAVPTWNGRFAGQSRGWGPWGWWEYSAFNLNLWLCAGMAVAAYWAMRRRAPAALWVWAACLAAAAELFALGDAGPSLFRLLNLALHDSVRVVGRYQGLISLALAFLAAYLGLRQRWVRRLAAGYHTLWVPACLALNMATFGDSPSVESFGQMLGLGREEARQMHSMVVANPRTPQGSFMYPPILLGGGVLNCYDPISRVGVLTREFAGQAEFLDASGQLRVGLYPFIDPSHGSPSSACRENSYFTQNALVLDPSCGPGTCVNVNNLNPRDKVPLEPNRQVGKFCLPERLEARP